MNKLKLKNNEDEGGADSWLTSFGDLMTLLLTFFILIVSFSNTELIKFRQAMGALQGSTGSLTDAPGSSVLAKNVPRPDISATVDISKAINDLIDEIEKDYETELKNDLISVEKVQDGVIIRMGSSLLFESGQASLKWQAYDLLEKIGKLIVAYNYFVVVEGHTDNIPIHTAQFPSNWDLSSDRALTVLKFFTDNISVNPSTIISIGRGEYKPIAPNDTPENRSKNRRVEIYLNYIYLSGKELLESRNYLKNNY